MRSIRPSCVFCERLLRRRSDVLWDQALAQTDDYLVVPTKGSLVPGWVLVVANTHILCAGALEMPSSAAFEQGLSTARSLVEPKFGPVTLFEHGPVTDGSALGCGVDHLHIHAAPLAFSLRAAFQNLYPTSVWHRADDWQELRSVHLAGVPYVAIREPAGPLEWCEAPPNVRQPLRRAVASGLGADERFDYNVYPYAENASRTIEALATV
jgi:diadenosine tetraphosphate (Ap4A) HIT family hydrolase